jgi:hypothetical protein
LKPLAVISLLLVLLLSQFGHLAIFTFEEIRMEHAFEARLLQKIPDTALERIVDDGTLVWEEAGREIIYKDKLYDIVRTQTENGSTVYYALNDRQEKKLLDTYAKNLRREEQRSESKNGKSAQDFSLTAFVLPETAGIPWIPASGKTTCAGLTSKLPQQLLSPIPTPPWA